MGSEVDVLQAEDTNSSAAWLQVLQEEIDSSGAGHSTGAGKSVPLLLIVCSMVYSSEV